MFFSFEIYSQINVERFIVTDLVRKGCAEGAGRLAWPLVIPRTLQYEFNFAKLVSFPGRGFERVSRSPDTWPFKNLASAGYSQGKSRPNRAGPLISIYLLRSNETRVLLARVALEFQFGARAPSRGREVAEQDFTFLEPRGSANQASAIAKSPQETRRPISNDFTIHPRKDFTIHWKKAIFVSIQSNGTSNHRSLIHFRQLG